MPFARLWLNRLVPSRHVEEDLMPVPVETPYGPVDAVAEWLRANGIEPSDVPIEGPIAIELGTVGSNRCIRYAALLRNEAGRHYVDESTGEAAREERTAPLKVDPPQDVQVRSSN